MPELRVTAGSLRGRKVPIPRGDVRPTSSRARQAFFNVVSEAIPDSGFLDLFAGSGIFSFEAVSRGARKALAIDVSYQAIRRIRETAAEWAVPVKTSVGDVLTILRRLPASDNFDVVYADPPYSYDHYPQLLETLESLPNLRPGSILAVEHRTKDPLQTSHLLSLRLEKTFTYGSVSFTLFEKPASAGAAVKSPDAESNEPGVMLGDELSYL